MFATEDTNNESINLPTAIFLHKHGMEYHWSFEGMIFIRIWLENVAFLIFLDLLSGFAISFLDFQLLRNRQVRPCLEGPLPSFN